MIKADDLKIFISNRDSTCDECHEKLGKHAWIILAGERGALCLHGFRSGFVKCFPDVQIGSAQSQSLPAKSTAEELVAAQRRPGFGRA